MSRMVGALFVIEAVICLGMTALHVLFGLFFALHHTIIALRFDSEIGVDQIPGHLYTFCALLGLAATLILLQTDFGRTARRSSAWIARVGIVLGVIAISVIPGGLPPGHRLEHFDWSSELFDFVLPTICLLHFAFLARGTLIGKAEKSFAST